MQGSMTRTVTIINILLGIVAVALLAAIVANGLSRSIDATMTPKGGKTTATPVPSTPKTADLAFYTPILDNGLFGQATRGQLTPIVNAVAGVQAAPATAPTELLLLGTATGSFRETFALVRQTARQEERVFRLGDMVFDAGRLVQVTREQAFIEVSGRKVELLTPMSPPSASIPVEQPAGRSATGVASTGEGSYVIDQRALNAALDNIGQAMTDARLLPSQKDGKVEGFRASEVKPSGVFAMIGIKNGDVLLSLNDFPLDSPDKALQSFIALKGQNRLKLDMIRGGRPVTFNYDIR
jgi:general secretion pathway protein C